MSVLRILNVAPTQLHPNCGQFYKPFELFVKYLALRLLLSLFYIIILPTRVLLSVGYRCPVVREMCVLPHSQLLIRTLKITSSKCLSSRTTEICFITPMGPQNSLSIGLRNLLLLTIDFGSPYLPLIKKF